LPAFAKQSQARRNLPRSGRKNLRFELIPEPGGRTPAITRQRRRFLEVCDRSLGGGEPISNDRSMSALYPEAHISRRLF
jgi:hypothetical protein